MGSMSQKEAADIYVDAILMATELGSNVVIEQIVEAFPDAIYCSTPSFRQSILHIAAQNRSADVFNLIHQKGSGHKYFHLDTIDSDGNNLLHAAAKLAPSHKLDEVSGAALQMEREIK
ncbi:hypothetical protein CDL12_26872 [Handroanthus impetiginosus]|uniref:Uncharacterized protein n=1 Tax=Handroanthus impetiginosus TaxID=429701 RepID=A0A2G9G658_9LAMI|nr:hypothetical protein CDL12_26872 [Handroanthus impetiginosus]